MPTISININATAWVPVSVAAAGFMENQGPAIVKFRTADALPVATDNMGHTLGFEKHIGWSRATAETIYAKTVSGTATLIVTEG